MNFAYSRNLIPVTEKKKWPDGPVWMIIVFDSSSRYTGWESEGGPASKTTDLKIYVTPDRDQWVKSIEEEERRRREDTYRTNQLPYLAIEAAHAARVRAQIIVEVD